MRLIKYALGAGLACWWGGLSAQAADLPVKANPVEYVKICSIYGEGFFYIPGTDTCIKIGGWVRMEAYVGAAQGSSLPGIYGNGGVNSSVTPTGGLANFFYQNTFILSTDVRSQTDYGTLRAYARVGYRLQSNQYTNGVIYAERAFMQLGGFTAGRTNSFFDFYNGGFSFYGVYFGGGSWTAFGRNTAAYTFQFGNGVSATFSVEDATERRNFAWDATTSATGAAVNKLAIGVIPGPNISNPSAYSVCAVNTVTNDIGGTQVGGCPLGDYGSQKMPDFVGNIRVDQFWGSAQVMAAVHQIDVGNYGADTANATTAGPAGGTTAGVGGTYTGTHPSDAYGYAVGGGILLNVPWNQGDKFWVEGVYAQGAVAYTGIDASQGANNGVVPFNFSGANGSAGWAVDSIFANRGTPTSPNFTGQHLTTAWTIGAAYEHYWTPTVRTSLWGVYTPFSFDSTATALLCNPNANGGVVAAPGVKLVNGTVPGCNPNFQIWAVGVRTIWTPVKNLDVGFEAFYDQIDNEMNSSTVRYNFAGNGNRAAGTYVPDNLGSWTGIIRLQRNFWP
jgi:Porin subfamily